MCHYMRLETTPIYYALVLCLIYDDLFYGKRAMNFAF
jgi:hypothetical protein